jgi:uncharacterized protein (TIGR03067 family)
MKSQKDMELLQGRWRQTALEVDGVQGQDEEHGSHPIVTFSGSRFSVRSEEGTLVIEGTFTLDATKHPKHIDWTDTFGTDSGKTFPAIYRLYENKFIFCAGEEGRRPEEFATRVGDTMREFQQLRRKIDKHRNASL